MKNTNASNRNTATDASAQETTERPAFPQALLDHVMANYRKPADLIGENGMLKELTKAVFEAALNAEITSQYLEHHFEPRPNDDFKMEPE